MVTAHAAQRGMYILFVFITTLLMVGCTHSGSIPSEASLPGVPIFAVPNADIGLAQVVAANSSADNEYDSGAPITLVKSGKKTHKKTDCPSSEVDENGKPVIDEMGVKHWPCGKVANGQGGYMCSPLYLNRSGCNNCPTCKCTNVGSGANQNCICQ
jgi:hypothetical protein